MSTLSFIFTVVGILIIAIFLRVHIWCEKVASDYTGLEGAWFGLVILACIFGVPFIDWLFAGW